MAGDDIDERGDFDFTAWASTHKLSRSTTATLHKEECVSELTLKALGPSEVNRLQLSIGQTVALKAALSAIGNPNFAPPEVPTERATRAPSVHGGQSSRGDQEDLRRAEQDLDNFLDGVAPQQEDLGDGRKLHSAKFGADPRINLTLRATRNKAQKIVNFLPEHVANRVAAKRRDRMSLVEGPDGIMSIKAEAGQSGFITLGEWSAANIRLLQYLLESGELKRSEIEYYQAYSLMIYEFLEAYDWGSILNFDTRYRELQAHHGFPWGTQNQQLAATVLIPRKQPTRDRAADNNKGKGGPLVRKDEQCRLQFTRDGCPYGEKCIYAHQRPKDAKNDNTAL